ncbi:glycoside hydrolase family 28 protein [Paenibacillus cremeus]|uniref:Glycoside hydrolase family 28 protein n=1 Tax=Paenibacillus cremeus TaxID=2163881 RepID=A0A559KFU5_9BACL|nr:glycoside hydrolase family 28 protein [Paenibacillus cremeus]TVY11002.1 glycoside hydrolase family 28 protein [Paenibacillus cremeus]
MSDNQRSVYPVEHFGAKGDGKTVCTEAIQTAIEEAAANGGGRVILSSGIYLSGALFLKSHVELEIGEGAMLRAIVSEEAYPSIWTRVAGIEMEWHSALLNVMGQSHVKIVGEGIVDGQGEYWWHKYWGTDRLGGMRKTYTAQGLRWAVDYDCKRPRLLLASDSSHTAISGLTFLRSPFWNVHICYSDQVTVSDLRIERNEGPSTDGIDIDSSTNVVVERCYVDCNDDNFCIKAGRDADGLRVNRPCENIIIRHCEMGRGGGITIGSETSGGVRNVEIHDITAHGTENGFRLKSARTRGGLIENIRVRSMRMTKVRNPFSFLLNWNPSYSYAQIPEGYTGDVPEHWKTMAEQVEPPSLGIPHFRNIDISDVTVHSLDHADASGLRGHALPSKAFEVEAYPEQPIEGIRFSNIEMTVEQAGFISHARDWKMNQVIVRTADPAQLEQVNCVDVELPVFETIKEAAAK